MDTLTRVLSTFAGIMHNMEQTGTIPDNDQTEKIITQTRNWIRNVVIQCNFCPFAARELNQNTVHYQVEMGTGWEVCLLAFKEECLRLDADSSIATTLLIFPFAFPDFMDFLNLLAKAEKLLRLEDYEGIYQVASFHPLYQFAGTSHDDASNYTNRSIYPMLHLLREDAVEKALLHYPDPEGIPDRNISFAREKGPAYMKMLRDSCL
jgi:uncharacterized protein